MNAVDPKRTGVKAVAIEWTEPPLYMAMNETKGRETWRAPPGSMIPQKCDDGIEHLIACPGCGEVSGTKDGAKWTATQGSVADVTTLTLSPSLANGCCGWHGYLRNGVFESC